MIAKRLSVGFLLGTCLLCLQSFGWAQENRGAITGTALDSSGAVIPGVSITLTDLNRGLKYTVISSGAGGFTVPALTVGQYRVEAQKEGFKKLVHETVTVYTGNTTTVNLTLEVGQVTQQVTVVGSTDLLQTTDAQVGATMTQRMYQNLPLTMTSIAVYGSGRRQPEQFILTEPGVSSPVEGTSWRRRSTANSITRPM